MKLILVPRYYYAVALLSGKPFVAIWLSMTSSSTMMTEMLLLLFRLLRVSLLSPRVLNIFLLKLRSAPKIDLPLSKFSLARPFLTSVFSISVLLAEGTKIVVLVEAVLEEERQI